MKVNVDSNFALSLVAQMISDVEYFEDEFSFKLSRVKNVDPYIHTLGGIRWSRTPKSCH